MSKPRVITLSASLVADSGQEALRLVVVYGCAAALALAGMLH